MTKRVPELCVGRALSLRPCCLFRHAWWPASAACDGDLLQLEPGSAATNDTQPGVSLSSPLGLLEVSEAVTPNGPSLNNPSGHCSYPAYQDLETQPTGFLVFPTAPGLAGQRG